MALLSALWQCLALPGPGFGKYWEPVAVARNLVAGRGFSNPYGVLDTGPTAHVAPVFPALLGALMWIFGDGPGFTVAALMLSVLAHALYCVLFVPLADALFHDRTLGLWAGIFSAVVPTVHMLPQWDAIYAAVGTQLFCIGSIRAMRRRRGAAVAGASCGALLLLNPALITIAGVWMAYLRPRRRQCVIFTLAAGLVCLPWTIRNYRQFGAVFFIRNNLGSELHISNSDCSEARDADNQANGCHILLQPNLSLDEAQAIRALGEVPYNRSRMAASREWIRLHPARFFALTRRRVREFWFPAVEDVRVYEYSVWLITLLSFAGVGLLLLERNPAAMFLGGWMVVYPVLYYFIQATTRYRSPVLWISVLPAAYFVRVAVLRARAGHLSPRSRATAY